MATKGYSTLSRSSNQEPHHQKHFNILNKTTTPFLGGSYFSAGDIFSEWQFIGIYSAVEFSCLKIQCVPFFHPLSLSLSLSRTHTRIHIHTETSSLPSPLTPPWIWCNQIFTIHLQIPFVQDPKTKFRLFLNG